ncbi:hypothetical protein CRUP_030537 [Coryphaenoides rupestris]|nr:hypothetical protein CRUP_030537 [Coryphaenoides rupestris]
METTVEKLEAMRSEADLDYIEKRLKLDFINATAPTDGAPAEVKEIAAAHKESMESIRSQLDGTLQLIHHFQQTDNAEISPLTDSGREAAALCGQAPSQNTADVTPAVNSQQQHTSRTDRLVDVSDAKPAAAAPPGARSKAS